jgi:serine phosphatase RsbU (regulator of sigma subunit)/PAS domain-containing protein
MCMTGVDGPEHGLDAQRLQLALDAGELGTWDWDLGSGHIRWDEQTARIFGISLADFDGTLEMFNSVVHPADLEALSASIQMAISACGTFRRDYRIVTPARETRWVSVRGRVVCDARGNPEAMLGVAQDRTEAHTAAERVGRTLETIDEAFYSVDHDWRFTYVNAKAEQLLRRTRDELLGASIWEEFPAAVGSPFEDAYRDVTATGKPVTFEARYGPLERWFEVRAYPDPMGMAVYFRDIQERRAREAKEQRAHAAAAVVLDRAPALRAEQDEGQTAATACAVAIEAFSCARASLWQIEDDVATLAAQQGGTPLPLGTTVKIGDLVGLPAALQAQVPVFVADATKVDSPVQRELAERKGIRSSVLSPIQLGPAGGTLLVSLGWDEVVEPLDDPMLDVVVRFTQQTALVVIQARRRRSQRQAAHMNAQLQSSLLPSPRVERPDLVVDALYRTGERRLMLGGDFYDCLELPDGSISLVIGDVTGHGPQAAATGATLRAAWRALALQGVPPGPKVAALDELLRLERDTDEQMVSVCCTVIAPDLRTAVVASAGHPPPILVSPEGARLLDNPTGMLLGAPTPVATPATSTLDLPPTWGWLLYSDGLPEARCLDGRARLGLEAFTGYVTDAELLDGSSEPLGRLHQRIRDEAEPIDDDVALLLVQRTSSPR